jgi:hypothetical protein
VIQHGANLLKRHSGKQVDKLTGRDTIFKILEQCGHGHSGTAKQPSATEAIRIALNRRT